MKRIFITVLLPSLSVQFVFAKENKNNMMVQVNNSYGLKMRMLNDLETREFADELTVIFWKCYLIIKQIYL